MNDGDIHRIEELGLYKIGRLGKLNREHGDKYLEFGMMLNLNTLIILSSTNELKVFK